MNALTRRMEAEKPGRLELAIVEWQRQLVRRREAQIAGTPESGSGNAASWSMQVPQDHSAGA